MIGGEDRPERVMVLRMPACEADPSGAFLAGSRGERLWHEAIAAVRGAVPGAVELSPGRCAMRARGPVRYYGGEQPAARAVLDRLIGIDLIGVDPGEQGGSAVVGVASGRFAAELAAVALEGDPGVLVPAPGVRIVETGSTAAFLDPLPVACAVDEDLAETLEGLGVRTLGAFAALPESAVVQRFGGSALAPHRRARGLGEPRAAELPPPLLVRDLSVAFELEPPLEAVDRLAFACAPHAERFANGLQGQGLVCTELRIELLDDDAGAHERHWSHPSSFTASDVVNRVRWQAASLPRASAPDSGERDGIGIAAVRIVPECTALAADHEPGLWSNAPDERVHHQLTRVQSLLGHEGVGTGMLVGGRLGAERQLLVPWGTAAAAPGADGPRPRDGPWPGSLAGAQPNTLFEIPLRAELLDAQGGGVDVDDDELLGADPAWLCIETARYGARRGVRAWSAPWPLRTHWWRSARLGPRYRLQVLLDDGEAWLLLHDPEHGWQAEGRYA